MSTTTTDLQSHGHGGHEEHNPYHQHHFTTMEQQFNTAKIGMWLFIVTEILLFGGLFAGFGLLQNKYPQEFFEAHHHLQKPLGALNTVVLLISSWTMVMAVSTAQRNLPKKSAMYLWFTILCACAFLVVKYFEYLEKWNAGHLPGRWYMPVEPDGIPGSFGYRAFFSFYFMMTGLHGFHIVVGIALLLWLVMRTNKGHFSGAYFTPVELVGLYWHVVDMIWIYLFPLYYLIT
jgi:cytochrome c oxidase subunit 3